MHSFNNVYPSWDISYLRHALYQSPMYFINFIIAILHSVFTYLTGRSPKRTDIVNFILNTCLVLNITNADTNKFKVSWKNLGLQVGTRYYKSVEVVFSLEDIHHFIVNDTKVTDTEEMLAILLILVSLVVHPKCHYISDKSVIEIKKKGLKILDRSTWSTLEIHYALLNSTVSPLYSNSYLMRTSPLELIENSRKLDDVHLFLKCKNLPNSQFLSFLSKGRTALLQLIKLYELDVDPEGLFNSILVHSTDHFLTYKYSAGLLFTANGKSPLSYLRSLVYRFMFVKETINPFESNLLYSIDEPFYRDLYSQLVLIDPEISSHITASLMY